MSRNPKDGTRWTADICDLGATVQAFEGVEAVAHCAAIPRPTGRPGREVFQTNMTSAYAAFEAARIIGAQRVIFASSFTILGYPFADPLPTPERLPIDEGHPVAPREVYGTSKWLGEELLNSFVSAGAYSAVSLRMPWIQTSESFFAQIGPRRDTGEAARDLWAYLDAEDAGEAFVAALAWPGTGHLRCYIAAPDSYALKPTRELAAKAFGAGLVVETDLPTHGSPVSSALAARELGCAPARSWRCYPDPDDVR